jgi:hypothetical protein
VKNRLERVENAPLVDLPLHNGDRHIIRKMARHGAEISDENQLQ